MLRIFALAAALAMSACASSTTAGAPWPSGAGAHVVKESPYSVAQTLDRLTAAVEARGARIFARIDHAAGAAAIDQPLAPSQVLIFGNPALGTPLMQASATAGVDLPMRVLAWRDGTDVFLAYTSPQSLARRHGIDPEAEAVQRLAQILDAVTEEALASD